MNPYYLAPYPHASTRDINAVLQLVADDMRRGRPSTPQRAAPVVTLKPVEEAFARAKANGVARPSLRLGAYEFSPAGENSRNAGGIYVKTLRDSGGMPGTYLGKVLGGTFQRSFECTPQQEAEIVAVARDPHSAALAFGKRFGRCSVCNRPLTDPESVARSIGPICAGKYGFAA